MIEVSVGTNYFFEIAKLRALRILFNALAKEYNHTFDCHIIATPTKRNKTLYDYNVNMLRTTTECMSAVLGGADTVANLTYDSLYHKDNEFGDRIARNQLLILKHESYFDKVSNPADGAYYIETLTEQLAEKALLLFKEIEEKGGFITQLIEGKIQKKISESAFKEQELFDSGKEVLLGTNKYPNKNDKMKHDLELFPFVKQNPRKTLIIPIIEKRLAEKLEQERLSQEQ
jgi:methylmalonyl-CoA mutase